MVTKSDNSSAAHCAIRLRTVLTQLYRRLRSTQPDTALSSAKFSALGQLYRAGPLTPKELAAREHVKLQSLTRLLSELEADGCVLRQPHEHDGRQTVLSLTPRGATLLTEYIHLREASLTAAIGKITNGERELLLATCDVLDRLAESLNAGDTNVTSPDAAKAARPKNGRRS